MRIDRTVLDVAYRAQPFPRRKYMKRSDKSTRLFSLLAALVLSLIIPPSAQAQDRVDKVSNAHFARTAKQLDVAIDGDFSVPTCAAAGESDNSQRPSERRGAQKGRTDDWKHEPGGQLPCRARTRCCPSL